jgi:hypothetical protein
MLRLLPLALAALIPVIQQAVDARRSTVDAQSDVMYLWSGKQVKRLSPGLDNVLADVYWLRTIQYFGNEHAFNKSTRYERLEPLIDITVALDPRFELAYRYGAVFLAEPAPNGAGRPEAALRLLTRGAEANPAAWRIRQDLGFFRFFFLHDAKQAAADLGEAARIPGAPVWLETSAADFLQKGGERETARRMWRHLFEETDGRMRENARFNLRRLDALDQVDELQRSVEEFRKLYGRAPVGLAELGAARLLRAPLSDPMGVPFDYDGRQGTVSISRNSALWRPHE